jgi:hypothetical protein
MTMLMLMMMTDSPGNRAHHSAVTLVRRSHQQDVHDHPTVGKSHIVFVGFGAAPHIAAIEASHQLVRDPLRFATRADSPLATDARAPLPWAPPAPLASRARPLKGLPMAMAMAMAIATTD